MLLENQSEIKDSPDNHWLNTAEQVALAGAIGGSIASLFWQEIILASLPLSACVALNLINRQRLLKLATTNNERALATLNQHNQSARGNLIDRMMLIQQSIDNYEETSRQLIKLNSRTNEKVNQLEQQQEQTTLEITKLAQVQSYSEPVEDSFNSVELYCRNGDGYQQLGEQQKALREYTKAIESDPNCARAYASRGSLYSHLGSKQSALADLRQAAKLYFARGDIDNYQKVKNQTQNIHQLDSVKNQPEAEQLLANKLFT